MTDPQFVCGGYSHEFGFVWVSHGTDCSTDQDMANFEESALRMENFHHHAKSNHKLTSELIEVNGYVCFLSVLQIHYHSPKLTQQTWEHFPKRNSASSIPFYRSIAALWYTQRTMFEGKFFFLLARRLLLLGKETSWWISTSEWVVQKKTIAGPSYVCSTYIYYI